MSLDYDTSKLADEVKIDSEGNLSGRTQSLIFATMAVGIGEITEANAAEFYARLSLWESVHGAFMVMFNEDTDERIPVPFTPQDVRDHIGLHTNVFPKESDAKWIKRVWESVKRDRVRTFDKA